MRPFKSTAAWKNRASKTFVAAIMLGAAVLGAPIYGRAQPETAPEIVPDEIPNQADAQLLQRFDAVYEKLDSFQSPGRESLNRSRSGRLDFYRKTLGEKQPVNAELLAKSRRWIGGVLPSLEAAAQVPIPAEGSIAFRQGDIKIDGNLDEAAWKNATPLPIQYRTFDKIDAPAHVRLLWDEQFLYIGFEVQDSNIIAPQLERDGRLWEHDCVEFFLLPDKESRQYWEVEISPTGGLYDSLCEKYPSQWGGDMKTEATLEGMQIGRTVRGTPNQSDDKDEGYTVEVAVPLCQLPNMKLSPRAGARIFGLFSIVSRDSDRPDSLTQPLAQTPYVSWFHNIWAYQPFVLEAPKEIGTSSIRR